MELFLITSLLISLLGMIFLLGVKRYELSSGRLFLAPVRPALASFFEQLAVWTNRILPAMARHYVRRASLALLLRVQKALAYSVLYLEHMLESVLALVREKTEQGPLGEPSAFLREVADHKKSLLRKSRTRDSARQ